MAWLRTAIKKLDFYGGRSFLARYATWHARRVSGREIVVEHDGIWMHKVDGRYFADGEKFVYHRRLASKWIRRADSEDQAARDYWFYSYKPQAGDVIVDVGAGAGTDIPAFSKAVGPSGRVIAIEAHPATFKMLKHSVRKNDLSNVTCIQRAIMDQPGTLVISDHEKHVGNSVRASGTGHEVQGTTLAAVCKDLGIQHVDFLKMNIEGAENYAVHGMSDIMKHINHVCIACHDFRSERGDGEEFRSRNNVLAFLHEHGFHATFREDADSPAIRDHVHASRQMPAS